MGVYRVTRNIEKSIIQYLEGVLSSSWSNVSVTKSFVKCYTISLPVICVRGNTAIHDYIEIGSNATIRNSQILIDLFCEDGGQRLDLKDFLMEKLKLSIPYYEYAIANGVVSVKTQKGYIRVLSIRDEPIDFNTPKDELDVRDRNRHLLTLSVSTGKVEE